MLEALDEHDVQLQPPHSQSGELAVGGCGVSGGAVVDNRETRQPGEGEHGQGTDGMHAEHHDGGANRMTRLQIELLPGSAD